MWGGLGGTCCSRLPSLAFLAHFWVNKRAAAYSSAIRGHILLVDALMDTAYEFHFDKCRPQLPFAVIAVAEKVNVCR